MPITKSSKTRAIQTDAPSSRLPELMEETIVAPLASSDNFSDCEVCHSIWSTLTGGDECNFEISLGSFEQVLSSKCSRHKPVVEWFQQGFDLTSVRPLGRGPKEVCIAFPRPGVLRLQDFSRYIYVDLVLVRKDSVKGHSGIARILDPAWIETGVVDHWRKRCLSSHGKRCENPMKIWRIRPAWVVDTKDACLTPGSECDSSIALSYRWGNAQGLQIQPDTMARLQRPGSLNDPAISSQLAPMVRHAIALTSMIGDRYLWVDTLCIDHSRAAESTEQLQLMGAIYANASLTIVVLDRNASQGFPGLKLASPHRDLDDALIKFGEEQFVREERYLDISTVGSYHQRGWTYQEFAMSSRRLILAKGSLNWMCQCGVSVEQLHPAVDFENFSNFEMREIMRGMPDLWSETRQFGLLTMVCYCCCAWLVPTKLAIDPLEGPKPLILPSLSNILSSYNERALTYDEDALPGISGLLTVFSRCFSGGFLYGIPEMFFEAALGWQPVQVGAIRSLRRRVPSDRHDSGRLHPCHLPSWSWIGWEGPIEVGYDEAGPAHPWSYDIRETIPITTWYTCDSPKALHKRRIRSSWFENRDAYKDFEKPLPPGWTQHTVADLDTATDAWAREKGENVLAYPDGCGQYIFHHNKRSEDEEQSPWYWPFTVPDIQESTQPFVPEQTPYLFCNTRCARAFAFQADIWNKATLYNGKDKMIGTLALHNEEQLQRFPKLVNGWAAAKVVELVAICRARYCGRTFDKETARYTLPLSRWEDYTILWVEWSDGIAYRLACGQVDRAAWEELALEDVSLILG